MDANLPEKELATYEEHKDELLVHSEGKFVLIHEDEVVGTYESREDAVAEWRTSR